MAMRLTNNELDWIVAEYTQGQSVEEICLSTGLSNKTVKRALAEKGEMYLSWHKTATEDTLLRYLRGKNVYSLSDLLALGV